MIQGENPRNVINIEDVVVVTKISAFYVMATSKLPPKFHVGKYLATYMEDCYLYYVA